MMMQTPTLNPRLTRILKASDSTALVVATQELRAGGVVAFPTETVYGLGGDATNDHAVAAIFAAKNRDSFNPLIVHIAQKDDAISLVEVSDLALHLMGLFWPGALTLVLRRKADSVISRLVSAGLDTIAIRQPSHSIARALITAAGCPIAAPSANRSGSISPTSAAHVQASLGGSIPLILDGGACLVGVESTVLDLSGKEPMLLRHGGVTLEQIESALGISVKAPHQSSNRPSSPGMLESHYAPRAKVRLNAVTAHDDEVLLGFGTTKGAILNLSPNGDIQEAAANLFAMLHQLDALNPVTIAVAPIPQQGLGLAIIDRLTRAAAPRPSS